ncbi:2-phospho-L-lactate guanylyltransferase [Vibrio algarum]|uniref:2-phospho-L-lactate guanylyltransferase n=1 Tax=Vibrio algarum TaxID=3020714 RepID=A0ABT4YRD9_9VIBR|nr:2-phospho-L-lactate guanylyltransferase [Vibrio sp. KJ40-1]MDB1124119.1 2-phospho-L-lactate guanylyltransferase [Vibrio sp. KJ40-1]
MESRLNIVIPMKAPIRSKQRLMGVLTLSQRETLASTLFRATLAFFSENFAHINRLVVTDSEQIARIAKVYGADVLLEAESTGLNRAIGSATDWSLSNGYSHQMVIPADIAKLEVHEVDQILAAAGNNNDVVIALAKDSGTNALLTTPPNAIDFCYGKQSGLAHAQEAHKRSLSVEMLHLPSLSQDIDVPDDLLLVSPSYQTELTVKGALL